jgi:hypothetical protein
MRIREIAIGTGAVFFGAPLLAAASWINATLDSVIVQDGGSPGHAGIVHVIMQTNSAYLPACHTGAANRIVIDLSRAPAKSQLAVLLAADASGRRVSIDLNESCLEGYALIRNVSLAD